MTKTKNTKSSKILALILTVFILSGISLVGYGVYKHYQVIEAPLPLHDFSASDEDTVKMTKEELIDLKKKFNESTGPAVFIDSLNVLSPMIQTTTMSDGFLELPDPPRSTWYQGSSPLDSDIGNSVIASHVDSGFGDAAPFGELHKIEKGTPILVRDFDGVVRGYKATSINVYERQSVPESVFDIDGDRQLVLVTCSGPSIDDDNLPYYMYNLVVEAEVDPLFNVG